MSVIFDSKKYDNVFLKLDECKKNLTQSQFKKIIDTLEAIKKIDLHKNSISSLPSEISRIRFIYKLTKINAEPSFCPGTRKEEVLKILNERIQLFFHTYQTSCKKGQTNSFFKNVFAGDPCLNGRFVSLENFAIRQQIGVNPKSIQDDKKYDRIAFMFTELMYGISYDSPPDKREFVEYLKKQIDYNRKYKNWVESTNWITIYNRAKILFA